ncbi:unnamed protein product [Lactuca virosa]|uniref:Uncharacterized protein n=1 Tax=Lactuca virosa TaxID=75947 RepID=A0AAU9LI76_9ASTR|nr:unnamed protein product [Lactuca virosa]
MAAMAEPWRGGSGGLDGGKEAFTVTVAAATPVSQQRQVAVSATGNTSKHHHPYGDTWYSERQQRNAHSLRLGPNSSDVVVSRRRRSSDSGI